MENNQIYDVFTIIETNKEDAKNRWNKIGTGFLIRDGSINVILDAYPANGRLHVRLRRGKEKSE
jgi:hypothetical protein